MVGFITYALFRCSYLSFLILGTALGLCIDVFCLEIPLGCYTISILGTFFLLKRASKYFYEDKLLSFGMFCFLVCLAISTLSLLFLNILDRKTNLSLKNLAPDFLIIPLIEALCRTLCLQLPLALFLFGRKSMKDLIQKRKESKA